MTDQNKADVNKQFDRTYERTNRSVTLFLISKCKNFTDINDVLQDVYMEYYQVLIKKGLDYIQDEEKFLISLCRKKIATYYSFWERIPHKMSLDEKESIIYELCDETDYEEDFFEKEMIEDVKVILQQQSDEIQKIFYLYYTMELKLPQIARLLGISTQSVKNKLFRTRKLIRESLKDWR